MGAARKPQTAKRADWLERLADPDPENRREAVLGLGRTLEESGEGADFIIPTLIRALNDRDYGVQAAAADALRWIGPPAAAAAPALFRIAKQPITGDHKQNSPIYSASLAFTDIIKFASHIEICDYSNYDDLISDLKKHWDLRYPGKPFPIPKPSVFPANDDDDADEHEQRKVPSTHRDPHRQPETPGRGGRVTLEHEIKKLIREVHDYDDQADAVSAFNAAARRVMAERLAPAMNEKIQAMPHATLEEKKELAAWVNEELRRFDLAIKGPTGEPSVLVAAPGNQAGTSRLLLEHKTPEGKRVRSQLADLPEFELIEANPRREPLREWNQKVGRERGGASRA